MEDRTVVNAPATTVDRDRLEADLLATRDALLMLVSPELLALAPLVSGLDVTGRSSALCRSLARDPGDDDLWHALAVLRARLGKVLGLPPDGIDGRASIEVSEHPEMYPTATKVLAVLVKGERCVRR